MKNKRSVNLEYVDIKSSKELKEAIFFLENGFKWNKDISNLLENRFPKINRQIDAYGIAIKSGNNIVGAILFFHQGYINLGSEKKPIINMSGWYVLKEFRGLPSITLLKYMLERYKKCIITNFSANDVASKILLGIGFKKMKLTRASLLLSDCFLNFSKIKIRDVSKHHLKIEDNFETSLDEGVGIKFLEVKIENKIIYIIAKKRILKRTLLGMKLNWRTSTIIWSSDENLVAKHWKKISLKLLLHTKSMKLICDFSSDFPNKAIEKENNYLFFSSDKKIDFIWPIQCEMNIFD